MIQSPNDDTKKLEEALNDTKLIDWNRRILVPYGPKNVMDSLRKVIQDKNLRVIHTTITETFMLDKNHSLFEDVR